MAEAGKGSKPRPFSVSHDEWSHRWDAIFGRDLDDKKEDKEEKTLEQESQEQTTK
jgi:hypothetical protein